MTTLNQRPAIFMLAKNGMHSEGYDILEKAFGDETITYPEFDFWYWKFANGEADVDCEDPTPPLRNITSLPPFLLSKIIVCVSTVSRQKLGRTCWTLRNAEKATKQSFTDVIIHFTEMSIEFLYEEYDEWLWIQFMKIKDTRNIYPQEQKCIIKTSENRDGKIYNMHFRKKAVELIAYMLNLSTVRLRSIFITSYFPLSQTPNAKTIANVAKTCSYIHLMSVKCQLRVGEVFLVSNILEVGYPFFNWIKQNEVETLRFYRDSRENTIVEVPAAVHNSDMWKVAKHIRSTYGVIPIEKIVDGFQKERMFGAIRKLENLEDLKMMMEAPKTHKVEFLQVAIIEPFDMKKFVDTYGPFEKAKFALEARVGEYKIPGTADVVFFAFDKNRLNVRRMSPQDRVTWIADLEANLFPYIEEDDDRFKEFENERMRFVGELRKKYEGIYTYSKYNRQKYIWNIPLPSLAHYRF